MPARNSRRSSCHRENPVEVGLAGTIDQGVSDKRFERGELTGLEQSVEECIDSLGWLIESDRNLIGQPCEGVEALELAVGEPIAESPADEKRDVGVKKLRVVVERRPLRGFCDQLVRPTALSDQTLDPDPRRFSVVTGVGERAKKGQSAGASRAGAGQRPLAFGELDLDRGLAQDGESNENTPAGRLVVEVLSLGVGGQTRPLHRP